MRNGSFSSDGSVRTFIAVDITPAPSLKEAVQHWKEELQRDRIRWVNLQQVHLTLTFLGDTSPHQVENIKERLARSLGNIPAFSLQLKGMGVFGKQSDPRVFWIGVEKQESLEKIKRITDEVAAGEGFVIDTRPFSPHITIARPVHIVSRDALPRLIDDYRDTFFMEEEIREVIFYESTLTRGGAVYTALERYPLA